MTIRIKELMETLTQANEAQEAVPAMKAELARLQRALEASQTEATRYKKASEDIGVELAETKSKASDIASQRDEAQFRTLELEEKLATISKALSSTLGLVEPPKASEVKAEPVKQAEPQPTQVRITDNHNHDVHNDPATSQAEENYWNSLVKEPQQHHDDDYNSRHQQASEVASPPNPTSGQTGEHSNESNVTASTPHSSSEDPQYMPEVSSAQPTLAEEPAYLAYRGIRWQDKPSYLSWSEFITQGGEKPYWM